MRVDRGVMLHPLWRELVERRRAEGSGLSLADMAREMRVGEPMISLAEGGWRWQENLARLEEYAAVLGLELRLVPIEGPSGE